MPILSIWIKFKSLFRPFLLYGEVRELKLADEHGGGLDEGEPRGAEEAGVGRMEHDVEADAERQDEGGVPAEEEAERAKHLEQTRAQQHNYLHLPLVPPLRFFWSSSYPKSKACQNFEQYEISEKRMG